MKYAFIGFCILYLAAASKPNILYIVVDDLRPQITAYDINAPMYTPNLDQFAKKSLVFNRAYCQQAVCSPSRNSFMTGRRPDTTKVWNFLTDFRKTNKDWVAFPQYFKEHGYETTGMGKLYHPGHPPKDDEPYSWSQDYPYFEPNGQVGGCANVPEKGVHNISCYCEGVSCVDQQLADLAVKRIDEMLEQPKPWFVGVGFHRPHVDWEAPKSSYDMYPNVSAIPIALNKLAPKGMPPMAFYSWVLQTSKLRSTFSYFGSPQILPDKPLPDALVRNLRRGYFASVHYIDQRIGEVLKKLNDSSAANNTIVIFHGDHGWQLGEHGGIFGKQTNFETGVRVPLMIHVPWIQQSHGVKTQALVELVDVYQTVAELAGLPEPQGLEGTSMAPLFKDPTSSIKDYAFSQYPRCPCPKGICDNNTPQWANPCTENKASNFTYMGYTVRSDRWRFTEWRKWIGDTLKADWTESGLVGMELYDHKGDPGNNYDMWENVNVAKVDLYQDVVSQLKKVLKSQFDRTRSEQ